MKKILYVMEKAGTLVPPAGIVICILLDVASARASVTVSADAWSAQFSGNVMVEQSGGTVTASCPMVEFPESAWATIIANAAGGGLSGDFGAAGVSNVSFHADVTGTVGAGTRAVLIGGTGRIWYSYASGGGDISIPFERSAWRPAYFAGTATHWDEDVADVLGVGATFVRGDAHVQSYTISGFSVDSDYVASVVSQK